MTARLIMWNLVTLEGFFEGPKKWDLDWLEYVWGDELERLSLDQAETADALSLIGVDAALTPWSRKEKSIHAEISCL